MTSVVVDPSDDTYAIVDGELANKGRIVFMKPGDIKNPHAPTVAELNAAGPGFETYIVTKPLTA